MLNKFATCMESNKRIGGEATTEDGSFQEAPKVGQGLNSLIRLDSHATEAFLATAK